MQRGREKERIEEETSLAGINKSGGAKNFSCGRVGEIGLSPGICKEQPASGRGNAHPTVGVKGSIFEHSF